MSLILTFLGKGGTGRTTVAIAAAKKLASQGKKVLLATQDTSPAFGMLLGATLSPEPQELSSNLYGVQFQTSSLLERSWEEVKNLEAQYLRMPLLKEVYGQELGVLPGMDSALALNAIREYDKSGKYDAIVYDGIGDKDTLRMLGMPEVLSWYVRRFQNIFSNSDLGRTLSPFLQPVASAVLNINLTPDNLPPETKQASNLLQEGKKAISDPNRVAAYLVTTGDPSSIATAKYLWGSAQQVGLTVGGVILNQAILPDTVVAEIAENLEQVYEKFDRESAITNTVTTEFAPLQISSIPNRSGEDWQSLIDSLPDFRATATVPKPIEFDLAARQVKLFLPGFDKKQVKLTQNGPEVTVEAGDQRRNIELPPQLSGQSVKGAKFQNSYLILSF
ncbi:arsenic-transporting ATPase [[Phormidium ambiguum] IAM M-71]|uniref:Arsenic-transporting ATPase n=1 Tax=[Phormidium ambiguum] IAM M-71 TaxID=454136 RepID=A0A1U7IIX3_9CYAN|nr:ArsA family ATPase [Phormidium ambiguum]OKH37060.1 arsenic-transporting ATPase [Phormidium ambiguum IAM M-71]